MKQGDQNVDNWSSQHFINIGSSITLYPLTHFLLPFFPLIETESNQWYRLRAYYTILSIVWTTESFYDRMLKQQPIFLNFFLDET